MSPRKPLAVVPEPSDDLAVAMANPVNQLTPFEGTPVLRAAVEMPGAAGGLRSAMEFEPVELHHDDEGYVVLHWRVRKVRFDEIKDDDILLGLSRVHVFDVDEAALIDGEFVAGHLADQRDRIQRARDAARGQGRLDDAAEEADMALRVAHEEGLHQALETGCPMCEDEAEAERDGD